MSRIYKFLEKNLRIKNYDAFLNQSFHNDFKILGLNFPFSRFNIQNNSEKKINTNIVKTPILNKVVLTDDEKIIGLDFPSSRFN
jgi:hypothetical protein